jgi:hypothetical protein
MKPTFVQSLKAGVFAGLISVAANNIWSFIAPLISGHSNPEAIHAGVVSMASFMPIIIGSIVFFLLHKFTNKGNLIFMIVSVVVFIATASGPFKAELPDGTMAPEGFAMFTFPMHIFSTIAAMWGIPKFAQAKAA